MEFSKEPRIESIAEKKLAGKRATMSLVNNTTGALWASFMKERNTIVNTLGIDKYSLQHYPNDYFTSFDPAKLFEKWAAVEVEKFDNIPASMETMILPAGQYAIFQYKGTPAEASAFFQYVFTEWLPNSAYQLDDRPHFEILGEKYSDGEEEVLVPVKVRIL